VTQTVRRLALSVVFLLLITSVAVAAHSPDPHHSTRCGLCALARIQAELPESGPVLAEIARTSLPVSERRAAPPATTVQSAYTTRAPPQQP